MHDYPDESKKKIDDNEEAESLESYLMRVEQSYVKRVERNTILETIALIAVIGMTILSFGYLNRNSAQITNQDASNTSNSMSEEKIIAWFCAGALGYAAFYAIGKNIAEK